eukprot:2936748-Prymnesium_polylepis.1
MEALVGVGALPVVERDPDRRDAMAALDVHEAVRRWRAVQHGAKHAHRGAAVREAACKLHLARQLALLVLVHRQPRARRAPAAARTHRNRSRRLARPAWPR